MISPLVSVIVPVYNVNLYLKEALNSVINQTYRNLEIIVVDDGSTDGSCEICDYYQKKDNRIRVIHQNNFGLSKARNTGLNNIHGDIIAFLDSDDAYLPKMIETMVKEMMSTNSDIVVCGYYICHTTKHMCANRNNRTFSMHRDVLSGNQALQYLFEDKINISVWNKLYKRELFSHIRFLEGHVYEDLIINPFIFENAHVISLLDQNLYLYRTHSQSITTSITERNILDWLFARNIAEHFIIKRTPSVFSYNQRDGVLDRYFTRLIKDYLALLKAGKLSTETKLRLTREINSKARHVKHFCFKTKLLYYSFKFNPYMCLLIERCGFYITYCRMKAKALFVRCSFI